MSIAFHLLYFGLPLLFKAHKSLYCSYLIDGNL